MQQVEWAEFELQDLFEVKTSKKRFDANKVKISDVGYSYVVRTAENNGIRGYLQEAEEYLNEGNTLSFGQDTATVFYQEKPYFTGDKIKILKPKVDKFGRNNVQFFISVIERAFHSFSWGSSSFNENILKKQKISLPVKANSDLDKIKQIDFDFIEQFIGKLEAVRLSQLDSYLSVTGLKDYALTDNERQVLADFQAGKVTWDGYKMADLFDKIKTKKLPYQAKSLPTEPTGEYILPCLTSSFKNQGLNYFAPIDGATILKNVISIPSNSDVYRAYFQSRDFTVLSDAYAIKWRYDDKKYDAKLFLFMVACINQVTDLPIYSYKNKLGGWNVVKDKYIQLPTKDNLPDINTMQMLISALQKLMIKDVVNYSSDKMAKTE